MKRMKQGYNSRLDESLGSRKGAETTFKQSLKDRRNESKGMSKSKSGKAYNAVESMDEADKKKLHHHMMAAHHKFMSTHHKKKMYKK